MKKAWMVIMAAALAWPALAQDKTQLGATSAHGRASTPGVSTSSRGTSGGTAGLLSSAQGSGLRYTFHNGIIPATYAVLGLTDEQKTSIEALCKEAQTEYRQSWSTASRPQQMSGEEHQKQYAARQEKQAEITKKYETRIADVLTPEQKNLLGKIKDLAAQKAAEEKKISETAAAAYKEVLETYKKKLYAVLPADQAKKIESEDQAMQNTSAPGTAK